MGIRNPFPASCSSTSPSGLTIGISSSSSLSSLSLSLPAWICNYETTIDTKTFAILYLQQDYNCASLGVWQECYHPLEVTMWIGQLLKCSVSPFLLSLRLPPDLAPAACPAAFVYESPHHTSYKSLCKMKEFFVRDNPLQSSIIFCCTLHSSSDRAPTLPSRLEDLISKVYMASYNALEMGNEPTEGVWSGLNYVMSRAIPPGYPILHRRVLNSMGKRFESSAWEKLAPVCGSMQFQNVLWPWFVVKTVHILQSSSHRSKVKLTGYPISYIIYSMEYPCNAVRIASNPRQLFVREGFKITCVTISDTQPLCCRRVIDSWAALGWMRLNLCQPAKLLAQYLARVAADPINCFNT